MTECVKIIRCSYFQSKRSKYILLASATMIILIVVVLFASLLGSLSEVIVKDRARDSNLELKLVHVIFRHGARTPADTYPTDPFGNENFFPFGWGQLTNVGKNQMFELGEYLRVRYDDFLGPLFQLDEVHAQCTDVSRTKMSIQLVLAALFPPKNTELRWNKNLNWQPVPFSYEELNKDHLLLVRQSCPRYHEELRKVFENDLREELEQNIPLLKELSNITGWKIETPDDMQSLYSTLKAESEFGLILPHWMKKFYPKVLQELTDKSYIFNSYNDELKRLKGGVFLAETINNWESKANEKLKEKIFVYAGHDATVTNILSAFKVWEQQFPDYAITAILELSQHKKSKEFGVEIFLRNSTSVEPYQLIIKGCEKFCPLDRLKKLLQSVIPENWTSECANSTFVPPDPSGP